MCIDLLTDPCAGPGHFYIGKVKHFETLTFQNLDFSKLGFFKTTTYK